MIKRDQFGIIVQHNPDYPEYADGGDSAARTGVMALSGSTQDRALLYEFAIVDKLVRHPGQTQWCTSDKTSRDQLVQWAGGVYTTLPTKVMLATVRYYSQSVFINKDILMPEVRLYLKKVVADDASLLLRAVGTFNFFLSLLWSCFVMPNKESNQIICMCSVYGDWWLQKLRDWHPDLKKSIEDYWAGYPFRDQKEIGESLWAYVQSRTK